MARDDVGYTAFWEDGNLVRVRILAHEIEFVHPRCSSTVAIKLAEFRRIRTVHCPECGWPVGDFDEMTRSLEGELAAAAESSRRARAAMRRDALERHRRLLEG